MAYGFNNDKSKAGFPQVENILTSTSTTNALSAAQGKALNDRLNNIGRIDADDSPSVESQNNVITLTATVSGDIKDRPPKIEIYCGASEYGYLEIPRHGGTYTTGVVAVTSATLNEDISMLYFFSVTSRWQKVNGVWTLTVTIRGDYGIAIINNAVQIRSVGVFRAGWIY